jgi:hypothetical protein
MLSLPSVPTTIRGHPAGRRWNTQTTAVLGPYRGERRLPGDGSENGAGPQEKKAAPSAHVIKSPALVTVQIEPSNSAGPLS